MKKIFYAVMLLLVMSIFSSCNKEGGNEGGKNSIVGTWIVSKIESVGKQVDSIQGAFAINDVFVIESNGNMRHTSEAFGGYTDVMSYSYDDNTHLLYIQTESFNVSIDKASMQWKWGDAIITFKRN